MQKPRSATPRGRKRRFELDSRLSAYSAAGKAAAIVAAGAASANAQTIFNLTPDDFFGGALTWQTTPLSLDDEDGVAWDSHYVGVNIGNRAVGLYGTAFQKNTYLSSALYSLQRGARGHIKLHPIDQNFAFLESAAYNLLNFNAGEQIDNANFGNWSRIFETRFTGHSSAARLGGQNPQGQFIPPAGGNVTGYLGFKANRTGSGFYYGWLRVQVGADANGRPVSLSLLSVDGAVGAYVLSSDPNLANFGAGDISAIPEPSAVAAGLGLFALGAAGVREYRRRRKAAA